MQINNIKTYNNSNQNFKALRIKRGSNKYISSMPDKVIGKLDGVGEDLANTKYYHLDIGNDGFFINHISGEKFFPPINIYNVGKALIIKARQGLTQITKRLNYETTNEVKNIEEKIRGSETQIERTAEIVKVLDNYEKLLTEKEKNLIISPSEPRETKLQKLIKKYGI